MIDSVLKNSRVNKKNDIERVDVDLVPEVSSAIDSNKVTEPHVEIDMSDYKEFTNIQLDPNGVPMMIFNDEEPVIKDKKENVVITESQRPVKEIPQPKIVEQVSEITSEQQIVIGLIEKSKKEEIDLLINIKLPFPQKLIIDTIEQTFGKELLDFAMNHLINNLDRTDINKKIGKEILKNYGKND